MENLKSYISVIVLFTALILSSMMFFIVDQRQSAVIFQFGEAVKIYHEPGLKMKIPLIQVVEYFDNRLLNVDLEAKEVTASDGKRIIVDAFARFKIDDPVLFYKTVYSYTGAKFRVSKLLESAMRKVVGKSPLITLLSKDRSNMMLEMSEILNTESKGFGINIVDVRVTRAELPQENNAAIYDRMQTERRKEASLIRAEGEAEANAIMSEADKKGKILLAEAYKKAQIIKSIGDKKAALIYSSAYTKDPQFYEFYQHINTYKNIFGSHDVFVIPSNSKLLKYLYFDK